MTVPAGRARRTAPSLLLAAYGICLAVLMAHHEPWRDELQAWMLARDSGSPAELWRNTRYEGHPLLWHALLWVPAHTAPSPAAMQVLHWGIATAAAAVVLLWAPFPLAVRAALVFGYFGVFEYGAISRNYSLTILGVWIACAAAAASRSPWTAAAGAVVAANGSPMGILLAVPLGAACALTPAWRRSRRALAALAAAAAGVALAVVQCLPPSDYEHARGTFVGWDLTRVAFVLRGFAVALLPVPASGRNFWGSSALFPAYPFPSGSEPVVALAGGAIVAVALAGVALLVRRSRRALVAWLAGAAVLLAFAYAKLPGAIRHHGFLWVLLVATLWLAAADGALGRRAWFALAPVLAAGVWGAAVASWWDLRAPFSGSRCAADAILARGLDHLPIVGSVDYAVSGVAAYLPHGRIFYPASGREGSFIVWNLDRTRQDRLTPADVVAAATARDHGEGTLVLVNQPLNRAEEGRCREAFSCTGAIVGDEDIWGYVCGDGRPGNPREGGAAASGAPPAPRTEER
jgi:hypothetical protein